MSQHLPRNEEIDLEEFTLNHSSLHLKKKWFRKKNMVMWRKQHQKYIEDNSIPTIKQPVTGLCFPICKMITNAVVLLWGWNDIK